MKSNIPWEQVNLQYKLHKNENILNYVKCHSSNIRRMIGRENVLDRDLIITMYAFSITYII